MLVGGCLEKKPLTEGIINGGGADLVLYSFKRVVDGF